MKIVRKTMEELDAYWTPEREKEFAERDIPEPTEADYEEIPELSDDAVLVSWKEFQAMQKRSEKQVKQRWFGKVAVL